MKRGFVVPVAAAAILGTGLVGVATTSATAATDSTNTTRALTPAQQQAKVRSETIRRYGVFPLPISQKQIKRYRVGKILIKQLVRSKRFAKTAKARSVRACESGGNYRINTGNGYYGAYQFNYGTWLANGGGRYSRFAHQAPAWAQDHIAWRTWMARGWQPWACA